MFTYRVEYLVPGRGRVSTSYVSQQAIEPGQWIADGSTYLVVERVVRGKRGDPYAGILLCKPAAG